ncbi:hypothetical protein EF128_24595 [Escherichia coli]|nr:hypothetical protein [Escherichia coli]EEW0420066.1 hypothetical protein [Escherichia coli]EEW4305976.1 hypothetical protein [Escherichia coli]EEW4351058.1 hypothetical protein [Escherichia coli]EEX9685991.1 hypothetical protein [Escherichia coli]
MVGKAERLTWHKAWTMVSTDFSISYTSRVARPFRSLQTRGFHASDRSDSPKPRQRVRRRLAGAPAAACRSRA